MSKRICNKKDRVSQEVKQVQINFSFQFWIVFLACLVALTSLIEIILRSDYIAANITAPNFGSADRQFEIQLSRLEAAFQSKQSINCIFMGDSLTWLDLDPVEFGKGYKTSTGSDIHCFNFGIAALPATGVEKLTEIVINEYNPALIIFGLHANSVVVPVDHPDSQRILMTSWVRYKLGHFSLSGLLFDKSFFFRNLNFFNLLIHFDKNAFLNELGTTPQQRLGFDPKNGNRVNIYEPPSRENPADSEGFKKYYNYQIYQENLQALKNIASKSNSDTRVVFVIMPVHETFYSFFNNGKDDYTHIVDIISTWCYSKENNLIKTNELSFSDQEWWDYSHLNNLGAQKLSKWLGKQVGSSLLNH